MITAAILRGLDFLGRDWCADDGEQVHRELASGLSCPVGFKTVRTAI